MKIFGNRALTSFSYIPTKNSYDISYGNSTLLFLSEKNTGNFIEIGYNGCVVDFSTRLLFYAQDGLDQYDVLPNLGFSYMPSFYSGLAGLDDCPTLHNPQNVSWVTDDTGLGKVMSNLGNDSEWRLGKYNKSIWFGEDDSFLIEFVLAPYQSFDFYELLNIGFDQNQNSGIKLEKHTLNGFKFSWGTGTEIRSIEEVDAFSYEKDESLGFYHIGIIKSYSADKITLYINGIEADLMNSPGPVYQQPLYDGTAGTPTMASSIYGKLKHARVCVADLTPANFSYMLYIKDSSGKSYQKFSYFNKNRPERIQMQYRFGGQCKNIHIKNNTDKILNNYSVEIINNFLDDGNVFFEDIDGNPLAHTRMADFYFVSIPKILPNESLTIRAIKSNELSIDDYYNEDSTLFFDDFKKTSYQNISPKWQIIKPDSTNFENRTYWVYGDPDYMDGLALYQSPFPGYSPNQLVTYGIAQNKKTYPHGYKLLFSCDNTYYDVNSVSGVMGVTLESDAVADEFINVVLKYQPGLSNKAGAIVGGTADSIDGYDNWSSANPIIADSNDQLNYYGVALTSGLDLSIKNYTRSTIAYLGNINQYVPRDVSYQTNVGFFFGDLSIHDSQSASLWKIGDFKLIPYIDPEPSVTFDSNAYFIAPKLELYKNGIQQF